MYNIDLVGELKGKKKRGGYILPLIDLVQVSFQVWKMARCKSCGGGGNEHLM